MNEQLNAIEAEYRAASERLERLSRVVDDGQWGHRADPDRWAISECVAHLNLTTAAYGPVVEDGLARAEELPRIPEHKRYRMGALGWMLWRMLGPSFRFARFKTTAPFVPSSDLSRSAVMAEFERNQEVQLSWVRRAAGLAIGRIKITSPFDSRFKYNVFSALKILPRHQHRHLQQAEGVLEALQGGKGPS
ncbi:MAG: DinB family protein [Acidobacteriota bacterium]